MALKEFMELKDILGNEGVEVCVLEDGRVVRVKALTLRQASVWCGEARQAVGVIARAQEVREVAGRQREEAMKAGDLAGLEAAAETRDRAGDLEAGYWARVERLVVELVKWGAVTVGSLESGVRSLEEDGAGGEENGGRGQGDDDRARLEPGDPRGRAACAAGELLLASLTAGQVNAIFETGYALSDPMYAVAGLRGALLAATIQGAARQVAAARKAMGG